jgi:membrane protein implicated in regulation of membrane protease activity
MPWWGWIVVGAVLLGAELFVVPTDFYLVFVGVAAIAVGLVAWTGVGLPVWGEWALFGVLSVVLLVWFRGWARARWGTRGSRRVDDTLAGEVGVAPDGLAANAAGRVELRGSPWSARNAGAEPIAPGARVRVERVEGLTLHVRRAD